MRVDQLASSFPQLHAACNQPLLFLLLLLLLLPICWLLP